MEPHWILNTSNQGKMSEFQRLFAQHGITLTFQQIDLEEIDSDPVTVVVQKASQMKEGVLVEDTSLDIQGLSVGIHVRWLLHHLSECVGKKALWRTLLAHKKKGLIYVYEGIIHGSIVQSKGKGGFGFDPFFLPDKANATLAESKPDTVNARAKAVEAFIQNRSLAVVSPITHWEGSWQLKDTP